MRFTDFAIFFLPCLTQVSSRIIPLPSRGELVPGTAPQYEIVEYALPPEIPRKSGGEQRRKSFPKRSAVHDVGRGAFTLFNSKPFHKPEETAFSGPEIKAEGQRKEVKEPEEPEPQQESELAQHDGTVTIDKGSSFIIYNGQPIQLDGKPVTPQQPVKRDIFDAKGKKRPGKHCKDNTCSNPAYSVGNTVSDTLEDELILTSGVGTLEDEVVNIEKGNSFVLFNGRPVQRGGLGDLF
ncbi:hypothetical protein RUND412_001190 [Rhizina undulata]